MQDPNASSDATEGNARPEPSAQDRDVSGSEGSTLHMLRRQSNRLPERPFHGVTYDLSKLNFN